MKDPPFIISAARARADEMLANAIDELTRARAAVCRGEAPGWPLIGDVTGAWLRDRLGVCVDDRAAWIAPAHRPSEENPPTVAEVIRWLIRVKNLLASNDIQYVCEFNGGCVPKAWAFVQIPQIQIGNRVACLVRTPKRIIHLCRKFWIADKDVHPFDHSEFQALVLIHEASHLYFCTSDLKGSGMGTAECLAQFVAAANGAPVHKKMAGRCTTSRQCSTRRASAAGVSGFGAAEPPSRLLKVEFLFDPHDTVRLKGRPARRAQAGGTKKGSGRL